MRSVLLILVLSAAAFVVHATVFAQGVSTVEYREVFKVRSLSGNVTVGNGEPVEGVQISLCSKDWGTVLRSTQSDSKGHFDLGETLTGSVNYLEFRKLGFNPTRVRVKTSPKSKKPLDIVISVSA